MERLDIAHNLFTSAFGTLHNAPLVQPVTEETETRILDVGSGTGIWAIEMAELVFVKSILKLLLLIRCIVGILQQKYVRFLKGMRGQPS